MATTTGERLQKSRLSRGMTLIELAKGLCTPSFLSQIENGRVRPSHNILSALASRLSVPMDHFQLESLELDHHSSDDQHDYMKYP